MTEVVIANIFSAEITYHKHPIETNGKGYS